jgi:ribonucleoside-diphosphate reductase alpha chain
LKAVCQFYYHKLQVSIQDHRLLSAKEIIALSSKVDAETYVPDATSEVETTKLPNEIIHGKQCRECGAHAVIKADGCERCTNCGAIGSCG